MRSMLFVCSFLAAAVLMTGAAFSAPAPSPEAAKTVDKCLKDKHGIIRCDLSGSEIPGILVTPKGPIILGSRSIVCGGLIEYRQSFLPEIYKTVEAL